MVHIMVYKDISVKIVNVKEHLQNKLEVLLDIQKSLNQYDLFRKEANFDEIYGDSDRTMDLGNNKILHIFEGRKFELALFDKNDVAIAAATIFGGGFKTYVDDKQTEEIFVVQAIELK